MSVITAENISKQYIIDHQKGKGGTTLRDMLAENARMLFGGKKKYTDQRPEPRRVLGLAER